jgi:hypothetical protein
VLDHKYGSHRVAVPADNVQLSIYALLVSRDDDTIEVVTVQILSPHFDFEPFTYTRAELDHLHSTVQIVIGSLYNPGDPVPGAHCHFCPARLICPAARNEAENATLANVIELPLGKPAAMLLTQIKRVKARFSESKHSMNGCLNVSREPCRAGL